MGQCQLIYSRVLCKPFTVHLNILQDTISEETLEEIELRFTAYSW